MTIDIASLTDQRTIGKLFKLAPTSVGLTGPAQVVVDQSLMSASAIISTPTPDRVNDVLVPTGCRLENYKKNPIVLWEHGFVLPFPIAKSEDRSGKLAVAIGEGQIVATSFFTNSLKESEQIFALIDDGIIRATSVRATPLKSSYVGDVCVVEEWDLEEWSWVCVPCNPEAVTGVIAKNNLAGSPIAEPILKSLKHLMPELKPQVRGVDLGDMPMAKSKPVASKTKADQPEDEKPEDEVPAEEPKADDPEPSQEPEAESPEDDGAEQKYGAQILAAAHGMVSELANNVKQSLGPLENEEVKAALEEFAGNLDESLKALSDVYSGAYGKNLGGDNTEEVEAEEDVVKSFLAKGAGNRLQMRGLSNRLKSVASAKNLTKAQQAELVQVSGRLLGFLAKANEVKPLATVSPVEGELAKIKKRFDEIESLIKDARPNRAR